MGASRLKPFTVKEIQKLTATPLLTIKHGSRAACRDSFWCEVRLAIAPVRPSARTGPAPSGRGRNGSLARLQSPA